MPERHLAYWPPGLPPALALPETGLYENLAGSVRRHPDRAALHYYGSTLTYAELGDAVERLATHLVQRAGVLRRDRVLLVLQNSPQFVIAFYAILRVDAVVVPANPMLRTAELAQVANDSGAAVAIVGEELLAVAAPLLAPTALRHLVVARYRDHLEAPTDLPLPAVLEASPAAPLPPSAIAWGEALTASGVAPPCRSTADDWCVIAYSSGTTGAPKGCLHSHRSVATPAAATVAWGRLTVDSVMLTTLPLFHVTGLQTSMNAPILAGASAVLMTRWDPRTAARLIERHRITHWHSIATMANDFLNAPAVATADLSSLVYIGGGGATLPPAVEAALQRRTGLSYVVGYGLTETMAGTHLNPPQRTKRGSCGIPAFAVLSRIVDPESGQVLEPGAVGEIVIHGSQVFLGYWNNPEATAAAFLELEGKRFLRTGDLGFCDEEGYFFLVDRLKRMINAAGFKVWPAEVEALLYDHPAILEACVVAAPDARRGEAVKAIVVLRPGQRLAPAELQAWCQERMAAYKVPRVLAFAQSLPRSAAGKILWRALQDAEWAGQERP